MKIKLNDNELSFIAGGMIESYFSPVTKTTSYFVRRDDTPVHKYSSVVYDGSFRIRNLESFSSIEAASEMNARMTGPFASNETTTITVDPRRIVMFENDNDIPFNETMHTNSLPALIEVLARNTTSSSSRISLIDYNYNYKK